MFFVDELTPLKLYPISKKVHIPINENDKKNGAALMLLTPNEEDTIKLMTHPSIINRRNYISMYTDKSVDAIINHEGKLEDGEVIQESKLPSRERSKLPDSEFGLPDQRKYPLNDKSHVLAAIRMFNHADDSDQDELAKNIKKKIKTFNMSDEISVGKDNDFSKYWNESTLLEVKFVDDKGNKVPKICPKCGSKVGIFLRGEPVFLCTNKDCNHYFGNIPFKESMKLMISESSMDKEYVWKTPEDLSKFMKSNIRYKNYTKLMTADEVLQQQAGSCHDQVMFELKALRKMGISPRALFLIEYNEDNPGTNAETHSLVYYKKDNKVYWFENAWSTNAGIHVYESLDKLKLHFKEMHSNGKWGNYKRYPELEITSFNGVSSGMTLQQLVDAVLESAIIKEDVLFKSNEDGAKFIINGGTLTSINEVSKVLNTDTLRELYRKLNNDKSCKIKRPIKVYIHDSVKEEQEFQTSTDIHCTRPYGFDEDKYGPYNLYLKNKLATIIINTMNPDVNEYICSYASIWLADQIDVFKKRNEVYWSGAYAIKLTVDKLGVRSIRDCILHNDTKNITKVAMLYWVKAITDILPYKENTIIKESSDSLSKYHLKVMDDGEFDNFVYKYKNKYKFLSNMRSNPNTMALVYMDKDKLVGMINLEKKDDDNTWIQGFEISKEYKNKGLAKQFVKLAIKNGATHLGVTKNNNIALKVYKDCGFKIYSETKSKSGYFMKIN